MLRSQSFCLTQELRRLIRKLPSFSWYNLEVNSSNAGGVDSCFDAKFNAIFLPFGNGLNVGILKKRKLSTSQKYQPVEEEFTTIHSHFLTWKQMWKLDSMWNFIIRANRS
ncbi:hypothetical protein GcC1_173024 [Golovinomyces cichoracearum]|uniref:Uncharacterized protein n=1 Tax=Golovinomyces cichoracearum TaxID=62708 RepID=A0A420HQK7_9PEZI|nr:hypothetical protein GcC1_173024 [Golovinomyces cichoracearum]